MFAYLNWVTRGNLTEQTNDRTRDGSNDQQQHHHGDRSVLIFVIECCAKDTVSCDGFSETTGLFKFRRVTPWNAFTLANLATHEPAEQAGGHSPCEQFSRRKPHSPMAQPSGYGTV